MRGRLLVALVLLAIPLGVAGCGGKTTRASSQRHAQRLQEENETDTLAHRYENE